ncbi:endonuclease/exonuclease/phosphatase family protein [Sphingomonas sp.]|uniref:endonuclease/exonuclease/phosphatase family protein n=1 Tax=Sphingomonas sp. TaxID=28214 RepID=UPI001ED63CA5|nr:endonuclease/exonuclease/phosphatase family protein [Sphingomonas sp.]MBX3594055.1 endonuclease/exonuclease/phosphatase family protein [Sphingomonas sp.]
MTRLWHRAAALLAILLALPALAQNRATPLAVMTYNIRLDLASDGPDAWPHRRKALTSLVAYYAPDIIGMQEVLKRQKDAIEADLPGYRFVGAGRDDGREGGEYSPVGYRADRFTLLASGTFWLSPTPDRPGKGWDAAYPRIASWAQLRDRRTGRAVLAVNTHLDHIGPIAQLEGARLIRSWIATHRRAGEPVVLTGDFNSPIGSPPYAAVGESGMLRDTQMLSRTPHFGPLGTFNAFKIEQAQDSPIDHIFVSDGITVLRHATLTQQDGGRLPSDHYPVLASLCIGRAC